jgi:hypothetical protein
MSSTTSTVPLQTTQQQSTTTTTTTTTSSITATTATGTATATKKKFGKNLTKIVQSQQPVTQTDTRSSSNNVTNRNGLLLLSTKKGISSNAGTSSSSAANPPAVSNLGTVGSSVIGSTLGGASLSQFDSTVSGLGISRALVSNGSGGGGGLLSSLSNVPKEAQPLDAWGVAAAAAAEKAAAATTATLTDSTVAVTNTSSGTKKALLDLPITQSGLMGEGQTPTTPSNASKKNSDISSAHYSNTMQNESKGMTSESSTANGEQKKSPAAVSSVPSTAWDEYGGRGGHSVAREAITTTKTKKVLQEITTLSDPDKEYMTSKARERALELQRAEEQRLKEQRDRITARLRELSAQNAAVSSSSNANNARGDSQQPVQSASVSNTVPLIHLTSYEDRDRGMPVQNAQPRMLFDPKSGSMVAVKSREEQNSTNNASNKAVSKKSSTAKKSQQSVNGKVSGSRNNGLASPTVKEASAANNSIRGRKNSDSSDTMSNKLQLLKNSNPPVADTIKVVKKSTLAQAPPPTPPPPVPPVISRIRRSLPRTCGVLYKRNSRGSSSGKGNSFRGADDAQSFCCADSCEGDLGYGAHSVPGGRMRNPDGYAKHKQQQSTQLLSSRLYRNTGPGGAGIGKQSQSLLPTSASKMNHSRNKGWDNQQHELMQANYLRHRYDSNMMDTRVGKLNSIADTSGLSMLYTGFNPSQTREPEDDEEEPDMAMCQLDWVTADDKLELIGMDDDEPTLKPTSKAFAPSKAALEAAATLRTKDSIDSDYDDDNDDIDDEIDNIHNNDNNRLFGVVGRHDDVDNGAEDDDDYEDYDDEEIDEHHHLTVNKAALNILEDDDDDHHHLHHGLLHSVDVDPLGLVGFGHIDDLLPKSTKSTSRLVQLEDIPMDASLLTPSFADTLGGDVNVGGSSVVTGDEINSGSAFNTTSGHNLFGFGSSDPWGTASNSIQNQTNTNSDWDILKLTSTVGGGTSGLGSRGNSSGGFFGSDNAFSMPSLVSGMPSTTSWGSTLEGLNLNGNASATKADNGATGNSNNGD